MRIELHNEIAELLKSEDLEQLVNSVMLVYAKGGFIRRADVAGMVVVNRIFKKTSAEAVEVFDQVTKDFKGVVVVGHQDSESAWIPSPRLLELLEQNQVVLVMKSAREKGISSEEVSETYIKIQKEDMV